VSFSPCQAGPWQSRLQRGWMRPASGFARRPSPLSHLSLNLSRTTVTEGTRLGRELNCGTSAASLSESSCLLHESRTNIIVRMDLRSLVELAHDNAGRVNMCEELDRPRRPPTGGARGFFLPPTRTREELRPRGRCCRCGGGSGRCCRRCARGFLRLCTRETNLGSVNRLVLLAHRACDRGTRR